MKTKLLLVSALLCTFDATTARAGITAKSLEALKKYCVPNPAVTDEVGRTICSGIFEGLYDGNNNTCTCYDNKNMRWDPDLRRCVIKCNIAGTHPRVLKPGETGEKPCKPGYYPSITIKKN